MLHQLLEDFPQAYPGQQGGVGSSREGVGAGPGVGPSPWATCMTFFRTNPDMKRLESSLGPGLRTYDPRRAVTPAGVLHFVSTAAVKPLNIVSTPDWIVLRSSVPGFRKGAVSFDHISAE